MCRDKKKNKIEKGGIRFRRAYCHVSTSPSAINEQGQPRDEPKSICSNIESKEAKRSRGKGTRNYNDNNNKAYNLLRGINASSIS
jgi:hypothetical protein